MTHLGGVPNTAGSYNIIAKKERRPTKLGNLGKKEKVIEIRM